MLDVNIVAQELLGKLLVHRTPEGIVSGMIVETEAYKGPHDAAAHSYKNIKSSRTEVQYKEGGYVYMYMIYGMYYCFNVVANHAGMPEAVLVRALEPVDGIEIMKKNRERDKITDLCSGPGKLCKAMGLNKSHYGMDLCGKDLYIERYKNINADEIIAATRINIDYAGEAKDYLWRYYIKNNKFVSTPR